MTAALSKVSTNSVIPIRPKTENVPKYNCNTCNRCSEDKHCSFFSRYVEPDYNRCFSHSLYVSTPDIHYQSPPASVFKEMQRIEAQKIKNRNRGFI